MSIQNASSFPIGNPHLPNVGNALEGLTIKTTIFKVTKNMTSVGEIAETRDRLTFDGVFQPMKPFQINLKPQGQRDWQWYTLHSRTPLRLKIDDIVFLEDRQYRVAGIYDFHLYGFFEFHLVEEFQSRPPGALPTQQPMNKYVEDVVVTDTLYETIVVSPQIMNAKEAKWAVYAPTGKRIDGAVTVLSDTDIRIDVPAAGTYRVVGLS